MPDTSNHTHADSLLDDYVMGTLSAADRQWMDSHIETCDICQVELPLLLEAVLALPFAADDPPEPMSDDLWSRIEASIDASPATQTDGPAPVPDAPRQLHAEPGDNAAPPTPIRSTNGMRWIGLAAAAVLLLGLGAAIGQALNWFGDDTRQAEVIAIHDADGQPLDVAELRYLPEEHVFVLTMDGMPEAPEGQVYQAWLIAGDTPIPMGTIDPATGYAVSADRADFDAFAITVEPGPIGSAQPTTNPIAVAPLQPDT